LNKLREAEILLNQGATITVVTKNMGVSDYTYYRWRKELEQENSRIKKLVADLSIDNAIPASSS
jgi:transposase-like protein